MPTKESFDIDGLMVFRSDLTAVDQDGKTVASVITPDKYVQSGKEPVSDEQMGRFTNTTAYWNAHSTYIPKKGEVIIYSDASTTEQGGVTVYVPKMKVGDGTTMVVNLPFTDSDIQQGTAGTLNTTNTADQTPVASESLSGNVNLHKVSKTGSYDDLNNKPTIPTVNDAVLTIQKNGTTVDKFSANASQDKTIDITVPVKLNDLDDVLIKDVSDGDILIFRGGKTNAFINIQLDDIALPADTKYAASISLSIDSSTYVVTAQLKDQDGNNLGSAQTIDLPLESVVVSGSYNAQTKKVVLTLQNGSTIEFSVADLVAGLQSEITAQNPLSADLVVDGITNKVFTLTMKTKLDGIEEGAEVNVQSDWNQSDNTKDDYIKNKPTIPAALEDLNDIDIYLPDDYDVLVYSELHQCWENQALSTVAFTGNYNQLNNKPSLATVATSGDYDDLTNKPTIPAAQVNSDWNASSGVAQILNKPDLDATLYESVTYSQLVTKINNSQLVKGRKYRITDYVTTTTQTDTPSAGHAFDLVVTAIDVNKLDHRASALLHSGDTYFSTAGADLSKWQIWYDVNNDTTKYAWADTTNGKGVIYRMIDEWENDCPYDFKNILFIRKLEEHGVLDEENGTDTFVYTFNLQVNGIQTDGSLTKWRVFSNHMAENRFYAVKMDFDYVNDECLLLNNNVFLLNNYGEGEAAFSNKILDNSSCNTFMGYVCRNVLHGYNFWNTFGPEAQGNQVMSWVHDNDFGYEFNNNYIGGGCYCIKTDGRFANNHIDGGNRYIYFKKDENDYGILRNIYVTPNTYTANGSYTIIDSITTNRNYRTTIGRDSSGNIRIYNEDDPASASQAQADWNETDTTDPAFIKNKPTIPTVPTNVSAFNNDAGYLTQETDPTVPSWAKAASKPSYDYSEIANTPTIPEELNDLSDVVYDYEGKYITNALTDYDGNSYGAVILGDQVWMAENLRTTHYADGTAVTYKDNASSQFTLKERGYFYLWSTVVRNASASTSNPSGIQGIAPTGWHIPSQAEFQQLTNYLSQNPRYWAGNVSTNIAKSLSSKYGWNESETVNAVGYNQQENNTSSFNAIPAGNNSGSHANEKNYAVFMTTTKNSSGQMVPLRISKNSVEPQYAGYAPSIWYLNVRCVYDGTPEQFIRMLMNKQVLVYDASKQMWVNKNVAEALPSMSGNSGKVLAVNDTETDVEWVRPVTVYSGSSEPSTSLGSDGDIFILAS